MKEILRSIATKVRTFFATVEELWSAVVLPLLGLRALALCPAARWLALCVCPTSGVRAVDATTFRNPGATGALQRCRNYRRACSLTT
jgi:hypothetical protein